MKRPLELTGEGSHGSNGPLAFTGEGNHGRNRPIALTDEGSHGSNAPLAFTGEGNSRCDRPLTLTGESRPLAFSDEGDQRAERPQALTGEGNHRTKGLLRLTMACNERCLFCNVPVEDYPVVRPPAAEIAAQLQTFVDAGERTLTISGGEPTLLRPELLALIAAARREGTPFVELQTNAILIDHGYAAELAEAGVTSAFVSLLSHVPALHDELAGLLGAFDRCVAGVDALLGAGVRVTLNPVIARSTQHLVPEYVDFVGERLPGVTSISLSAVQPHGRAKHNLDLMPDYDVLAEAVRRARGRAHVHGLRMINPYCGLPLCVGWDDEQQRSVEAIEATAYRGSDSRGFRDAPGVRNVGDKRHGAPCGDCALRTRCGGAWHAYWDHRDGRGLFAPLPRVEPWYASAGDCAGQAVIEAQAGIDADVLAAIRAAEAATVWVNTNTLAAGDAERLWRAGCTDLALACSADELRRVGAMSRELRAIGRANADRRPQTALRVAVALTVGSSFRATFEAARIAVALGVDSLLVCAPATSRWQTFVEAARRELPNVRIALPGDSALRGDV